MFLWKLKRKKDGNEFPSAIRIKLNVIYTLIRAKLYQKVANLQASLNFLTQKLGFLLEEAGVLPYTI